MVSWTLPGLVCQWAGRVCQPPLALKNASTLSGAFNIDPPTCRHLFSACPSFQANTLHQVVALGCVAHQGIKLSRFFRLQCGLIINGVICLLPWSVGSTNPYSRCNDSWSCRWGGVTASEAGWCCSLLGSSTTIGCMPWLDGTTRGRGDVPNPRLEKLPHAFDTDHANYWRIPSRINNLLVIMNISMFFLTGLNRVLDSFCDLVL